ncbi:MAG: lipopolysaccharide transport periplasmic protein LptA [Proteobacteria bacterium]|nr:lipopolysaccharide transport periplasmic protein LptA [Pseudomonadota bacterium]
MQSLIISLLLFASQSMALESDRLQKIVLDGPGCTIKLKLQQTLCEDGLTIKQGTMLIKSSHAIIHHKDNSISKMIMKGKPVYFEQLVKVGEAKMVVTANNMDYRKEIDKIFMKGDVKIVSSIGITTGEEIEFDIIKQEIIAVGEEQKQQFHMVIEPDND